MSNNKKFIVKNGLITQNTDFVSSDALSTITAAISDSGVLSFEGAAGELFSISDSQEGTIYSVNLPNSTPAIEVDADGTIRLAETGGRVLIGTNIDDGVNKLQVDGGIVGTLVGSAETLTTARTIALGGDVSGSVSFDGSANVTITTTVADNSHNHIIANVDGLQGALDAKVAIANIINNLTSNDTDKPLSANQGLVLKGFIDNINTVLQSDDATLDELQEIVDFIKQNRQELDTLGISNIAGLQNALDAKVDKVAGKGLSTEDYTTNEKNKLAGIEPGAQVNVATNLGITGAGDTRTITSSTGTDVTVPVASTSTAGLMATGDKSKLDGIAAGAQVNVATNLTYSTAATTGTVNSSTGTNATIPAATTSLAGLMTNTDKSKLDGIAAGAQVNVATNLSSSGTGATRTIASSTGTDTSITYSAADVGAPPTSLTITAGNGLTGGGNLTADRTITLGTPETITTTTTNSVSTSGHSHALTLPASATRGEISTANINNTTSSTLGFISGRRMNDALTNYGDAFSTTGTFTGLTAGQVQNSLTPGSFITGSAFNGSVARTWNINATSANTASAIVARDGSGNFSANIMTGTATQARYADLAERCAIDQRAQPGTVVMSGGDQEITQSTTANDHRVVGVVSTDPAYLMNCDAGDDQTHPAIALTGRVPVRVTGTVNPGDLMVTSDIPGHAQADNHAQPGRIIGKAIGKNSGGEGVIEVLITLM